VLEALGKERTPPFAVRQPLREAGRGTQRVDVRVANEQQERFRAERGGDLRRRFDAGSP
jgi:hypothetical protein